MLDRRIARAVFTGALVVLAVALAVYLLYLVRQPLGMLLIALFVAVAVSGPVNALSRRMRRGFAILLTYLTVILVPLMILAVLVVPVINGGVSFVDNLPQYAQQLSDEVQNGNGVLHDLNEKYDVTATLQKKADALPSKIDDAAAVVASLSLGIVDSIFQLVTILILSIFMVAGGRPWVDRGLDLLGRERAVLLRQTIDGMASAVGSYIGGALAQALIAGVSTFVVLKILGVPYAAPLAVLTALFDLIPMVGATIAAVIVGIVTVFEGWPVDTIIWTIWAIVYQQVENSVIQPRIQSRAVGLHPFLVVVSVLFGAKLLGVLGAILAVPVGAAIQIGVRDWWTLRQAAATSASPEPPEPPAAPRPAPTGA
jgi:predicted PurR-regulated permease PerM